ncbi:TetR/AcrR family transcriptional regulator [Patulibacter defluvii]|uniref:TetR/AcrR family transcriptional regulator n=1 Tax=Patulibacter defluvii TaxID=3095358 RepID=UPI002A7593EE|nr:helix-turn-helix domain-containing protein [Patulibacter sp. DM4]
MSPAPRRRDAVRNRDAILRATAAAVTREGAEALRVAEVARAAGVGPGTIYRAFGDKRGLLLALVDEQERRLQEDLLRGPPPLGPGAAPDERLEAFLLALQRLVIEHRDVLAAADGASPASPFRTATHAAWHQHLVLLLRQRPGAAADDADPVALADLLLATVGAGVHQHLLDERGVSPAAAAAALRRVLRGVLG